MTAKQEVLFLAHRMPYPPNKGDKIRSWRLLKHLSQRFDVHLACFIDDPKDHEHCEFLENLCASATFIDLHPRIAKLKSLQGLLSNEALSMRYYRDARMEEAVLSIRSRPLKYEIAFSSTMAQYIETGVSGRKRIVDFCDADSEKWRQYADETSGLLSRIYNREARLLSERENTIANWADASFAVTPAEAILFNCRPSVRRQVGWWSNGVDTDYFNPAGAYQAPNQTADIVFTGAMDYRPNVEAALNFAQHVWPQILTSNPKASFAIVGSNPVSKLKALDGKNGVIVTGRVEDVRPWIAHAKIAIAPLLVARGVQNKVLEAMAMAKPIVATHAAATGLKVSDGENILIADSPDEAAEAILRLMNDASARTRLGDAARQTAVSQYSWPSQLQRFDAALADDDPALRTAAFTA